MGRFVGQEHAHVRQRVVLQPDVGILLLKP